MNEANEGSLRAKITELICATLGIPEEKIVWGAEISALSEDSIRLFELVLAFEREFGLKASYEDLMNIRTVEDIYGYLNSRLTPMPDSLPSTQAA